MFLRSAIWTGLLEVMLGVSKDPHDRIKHMTYIIDEFRANKPAEEAQKTEEPGRVPGIPGID